MKSNHSCHYVAMIIDTHAHLMFDQFAQEVPEVIERARAAGVEKIINIGCTVGDAVRSVEMAEEFDCLYATVGLHPYDAADATDRLMSEWANLIKENKKIVAVGECGLDYFKAKVPMHVQKKAFSMQLELAREVGLPVVVHNREADEDTLSLLGDFSDVRAVFHCYGSDLSYARKVWNAGHMTSFTGIITYPNADSLRDVVKVVPMNMFMVETDSPYLAPQTHRGERNEPSFVVEVVKMIAEVKGIAVSDVVKAAEENSLRFFERL